MATELDALVLPAFSDLAGLPGEHEPWIEEYDLDRTLEVPGVERPVSHDGRVGVVPTGIGKPAAAATTTALRASDDLDLSSALVLSVGIAGGPPSEVTVGSVVLADAIVDWDDKSRWHDDDGTSIATNPYNADRGIFELDPDRVAWAERIVAGVELADDESVAVRRHRYDEAAARSEPSVRRGVNVCSDELWHGRAIAERVQGFVDEYGAGTYCATEMEDVGTALALARFDGLDRYLSVRGISNFDRPAPGQSAEESLFGDDFEAGVPLGLDNAVRAARVIVDDWLGR